MARTHADDVQFRAVIRYDVPERNGLDGRVLREAFTRTEILGPYQKPHTAAAQITRAARYWPPESVTGHVEVGQVMWRPVEQADDVVLIPADELRALRSADATLDALHSWGVDNWEGYGDALSGKDPDE